MRVVLVLVLITFFTSCVWAQHSLKIKVIDQGTSEVLPGAKVVVLHTTNGSSTDSNGITEIKKLKADLVELKISFIGYSDSLVTLEISYDENLFTVGLMATDEELDEVIIASTRTNSRIEDLPLKVAVLGLFRFRMLSKHFYSLLPITSIIP